MNVRRHNNLRFQIAIFLQSLYKVLRVGRDSFKLKLSKTNEQSNADREQQF